MTAVTASTPSAVVTLGMYDPPYLNEAQDVLWAALRRALVDQGIERALGPLPQSLDRQRAISDALADPRLALGHTCGYPLRKLYAGRLKPLAQVDSSSHRYFVGFCLP